MKTKIQLFLLAILCVIHAEAWAFDVQAVAQKMVQSGTTTETGQSDETGFWIVAIGSAPVVDGNSADARILASLDARKTLGAFLNSTIATSTEFSLESTDDTYHSSLSQWMRSDVNELLRGAREVAVWQDNARLFIAMMATEKVVDATGVLRQAMASETPNVVEAEGVGTTREEALAAACRSALEQVSGLSVVAASASVEHTVVTSHTYSDVSGIVSSYRILSETVEASFVRVRIVAEIDEEDLQESYSAELKSLGDPLFCITSTSDDALRQLSDWFIGRGLKTTTQVKDADYKIEILTKILPRQHPSTGKEGLQLQLTVVCYDKSGEQLFSLQNDPRKATSFVGTPERQSQLVVEKAVKQIEEPLHARLQQAIARMVNNGRTVRMVFRNVTQQSQSAWLEQLTAQLNDMPGATSATYSYQEAVRVATIRFSLKGHPQNFMNLLRAKVPDLPPALAVTPNKIIFEL